MDGDDWVGGFGNPEPSREEEIDRVLVNCDRDLEEGRPAELRRDNVETELSLLLLFAPFERELGDRLIV